MSDEIARFGLPEAVDSAKCLFFERYSPLWREANGVLCSYSVESTSVTAVGGQEKYDAWSSPCALPGVLADALAWGVLARLMCWWLMS